MTSPFWHTQHGVSSSLWQTQSKAPRRPERSERPDAPTIIAPTQRSNTPCRRTRVETQFRVPAPSPTSRPPIRSRYTSPVDRPQTNASSKITRRSSGSPKRVYSSSSQPVECGSPVMTLRILSPSRNGARDQKNQVDQENRPAKEQSGPPVPVQSLSRSSKNKLISPKRRRLPLRDSILLKRKDLHDSSKPTTPASTPMPKEAPETPEHRVGPSGRAGLPPTPTTPSRSRLKGLSRLAAFSRDSKLARPPAYRQSEQLLVRNEPNVNNKQTKAHCEAYSEQLVSRVCTMILNEGLGGSFGADRSSAALKVWDAVVKCLDEINVSSSPHETARKRQLASAGSAKRSQPVITTTSNSKNPWPLEAWGFRHSRKKDAEAEGRRASELLREENIILKTKNLPQLRAPVENDQGQALNSPLPCPFRARNPSRFNVTDSWYCAQGQWKNISELQHHITSHHRHSSDVQLFQCPRCEMGFSDPNAFKDHLLLPREQMCDPRSEIILLTSDPEDGITTGMARALSEDVELGKIASWDDLWKCLFPADRIVPRPAILPAIELPQVEQEVFASDNMANLKTSLEERLRFLASQSANSDLFSAQIPVITGSISLVVEAHLRSVFISCRTEPPSSRSNRSRSASQSHETINIRPRKLSSASSAGVRNSESPDYRRPVIRETKSFKREALRPQMYNHPSRGEGSQAKLPRAANLPIPSTLTIPFPRISALTEQSDVAPSHVSEEIALPKGSDGEYSSGVESDPTSAGGLRDSNNTDIRCSKCNMRPSLCPDEDIFSNSRGSASSTHATHDSGCRFSDSGIGILCRNCRMLEELINSYSRASSHSAISDQWVEGPGPGPAPGLGSRDMSLVRLIAPFPSSPSMSMDENDEATLFDILESAPYVVEDGRWESRTVLPKFPPPTQSLPPSPLGRFDGHRHNGNFF